MYEQGRAAFLAVLMVLSVVAMTASFAGAAAAVEDPGDSTLTVDVTDGQDPINDIDVTVESETDDASATYSTGADDNTVQFDVNQGTDYTITIDEEGYESYTQTVSVDSAEATHTAELSAESTDPGGEDEGDVLDPVHEFSNDERYYQGQIGIVGVDAGTEEDVDLMDNESDNIEYELSIYEAQQVEGEFDDVGDITTDGDYDFEFSDGETVAIIQTDDLDEGTYYLDGEEFKFDIAVHELGAEFEDGNVTNVEGGSSSAETELDIESAIRADFSANVSADNLDAEELWSIFAEDGGANVEDVEDVEDSAELEDTAGNVVYLDQEDDVIVLDARGSFTANFSDVDAGEYEFTVEASDTTATDTATVTVNEDDADRNFNESTTVVDRGDIANISVDLENTDTAALQVGIYDDVSYEVGLSVDASDYDGDDVTVTMNTHEAGGALVEEGDDVHEETAVWGATSDDVDVTVEYVNMTGDRLYVNDGWSEYDAEGGVDEIVPDHTLSSPLEGDNYEMTLGDEWELTGTDDSSEVTDIEMADDDDSAYLSIRESGSLGDVGTYTAPANDDLGDFEEFEEATVTDTNLFAEDDHMIVTIDDFAMTGALDGEQGDISGALTQSDVYLEMEELDSPANQDPRTWNSSNSEVTDPDSDNNLAVNFVNADDYEGDQLILDIEGNGLDYEDKAYNFTIQITDDNPYLEDGEGVEQSSEVTLEERSLSLDDSNEELPNTNNASVTGETNVAPGTVVDVRASSGGNFVMDDGPEVTDDRLFTGSFDFSEYEEGLEIDLEATESGGSASDEMDAVLFDAEAFNAQLSADAPEEATVGEDATLDVTVENNGGASGEVDLGVVIGGENTLNETITLDAGEEWSNSFDYTAEETGDVEWSVVAGDNEETGTTTFSEEGSDGNESDSGSDSGSDDGDSGSDSGSDDGDSGSDDGDDGSDGDGDGTPGFGVAVALAALLGAAMLALRKQN